MSDLISRREAKNQGLNTYFDGEFCENFHISERFTSSGKCCECSKDSHKEFLETSRAKKAKKKLTNKEKRETNRFKRNEESKLYEELGIKAYEYNEEFSEDLYLLPKNNRTAKTLGEMYYFTGKPCVHGHLSKRLTSSGNCTVCDKARSRMDALLNPDKKRAAKAGYRKRKFEVGGTYTAKDIKELFAKQSGRCVYCDKCLIEHNYHVDHIMPIILGGRNSKENLQLLCPVCNLRKGGKHPDEFLKVLRRDKFNYEDYL